MDFSALTDVDCQACRKSISSSNLGLHLSFPFDFVLAAGNGMPQAFRLLATLQLTAKQIRQPPKNADGSGTATS